MNGTCDDPLAHESLVQAHGLEKEGTAMKIVSNLDSSNELHQKSVSVVTDSSSVSTLTVACLRHAVGKWQHPGDHDF